MFSVKRHAKSRKTGHMVEYSYQTIGSKPAREYLRDKKREYRMRAQRREYSPVLSDTDQQRVKTLYAEGWSQLKLANHFHTTRYRIERTLGLR